MSRDNSNKYRKSSPKNVCLSLLSSPTAAPNLRSDEQVSVCTNEVLASLIYTIWQALNWGVFSLAGLTSHSWWL